ncbi:MAG: GTP-binding protein [Hyphomicrobiaceae bacterium]
MAEDFHCQASKRSERRPVGAKLKELQDRLVDLATRLMRETDADATALVSKALDAVQNQRLSVSVVGQVNAGKTTLVNALARQRGLLPVSQAPWTAVITRLHFGLHGFPEQSAHFRFFDAGEWQRLSEQGGKLRELAERFLPGFNSEQLHQQVQAMRHRAEARLGPAFTELLGSTHSFASLEPEVVAQYVSAGPTTEQNGDDQVPNYADITRTADLFFALRPFAYPLTLIDTPGTNDPFLVREEMTLLSLDASDACIVVIDATKGVTDSDLGLFRILRGVNSQRLILFINKQDLLLGPLEQRSAATDRIARIVRQELGSSVIPTIIGSAADPAEATTRGARVWMDELEDAMSALIHHGHSAHYVHQAAATLMTLADGVRSQAAAQIARLQSERALSRAMFNDEVERARAVAFSEDLAQQINRTTDAAISSLQRVTASYEEQALSNLQQLVETFAATKKREFLDQYPETLPAKTINFDISGLRQRILATHTHDYRRVRREITNALRVTTARLAFLMNKVETDAQVNLDFNSVSEDFIIPSQAPLGQTLAIDLEEPFWRRWWRRRVTSEEAAQALEALIVQEFTPIISELVTINKGELASEIDYASLQLSINGTNLAQSLKSRQLTFSGSRQVSTALPDLELVQEGDAEEPPSVPARSSAEPKNWQHQLGVLQAKHRRSDLLVRDFAELTDHCQRLLA